MKKVIFYISLIGIIICSCNANEDETNQSSDIQLTEAFVELGIKYGPEDRQFLDLFKARSDCPTTIYFDAHANGQDTSMPSEIVDKLNAEGITVISWESITLVKTPEDIITGWSDAELMFQWVIDNAETYNIDTSNIIIGGSSRGTILSWIYGHKPNSNIKGLYMYNALPKPSWAAPSWWLPTDNVTMESPPIYFVYKREPGSSTDIVDPDIHDPNYGTIIVDKYVDLDIGNRATLIHSIGQTNNVDRYQFLVDFALSVIERCP